MKKSFWLYLQLIIIFSFNVSNAQWVKVRGGMPWCFTNDSNYLYAGIFGGGYISGDTTAPRNIIRSSDNGTSWINVSNGLLCDNVFSLTVKGSKLFTGSDSGNFDGVRGNIQLKEWSVNETYILLFADDDYDITVNSYLPNDKRKIS